MPRPNHDAKARRLKWAAGIAVAFIALTIIAIFIGENLTHKQVLDEAKQQNAAAIG